MWQQPLSSSLRGWAPECCGCIVSSVERGQLCWLCWLPCSWPRTKLPNDHLHQLGRGAGACPVPSPFLYLCVCVCVCGWVCVCVGGVVWTSFCQPLAFTFFLAYPGQTKCEILPSAELNKGPWGWLEIGVASVPGTASRECWQSCSIEMLRS